MFDRLKTAKFFVSFIEKNPKIINISVLVRVSSAMKRHHDHSIPYNKTTTLIKAKHLMGVLMRHVFRDTGLEK